MKLFHFALIAGLAASAFAQGPTYSLVPNGSNTAVILDSGFVNALGTLKVTPGGLETGNLAVVDGKAIATFPIPTSRIDFSNLRLQIVHSGGLSLRAGSTFVTLSDFIIENFAAGPRLTGLVKVNETIVGRLPLFTLTLNGTPEIKSYDSTTGTGAIGTLAIKARLNLTAAAASALNGVFGVTAFTGNFLIGEATVSGTYTDVE